MKKLTIGFIGNFGVPYTTENDRKWSFQQLGHTVIPLQENQMTAHHLSVVKNQFDLLLYSHTHGWEIEGLKEVFAEYKRAGIPTASAHLDRWLWLEREQDMGQEATWFTEWQFMADGSPEAAEKYDSMGLKWHWLKPGVVERDCYLAKPDRKRFPHDVIFVGSKGYHPEYPFRHQLIDWLKETYGERFGHYGNDGLGVVRGDDLNVLYASAKVVVGDSCFGGRPRYWSDRIPETTGRGGFLIHPYVDDADIDNPHIAGFDKDNLNKGPASLKGTIDHYLTKDDYRENRRKQAHEWTKENATYTHRSTEMLKTMNLI